MALGKIFCKVARMVSIDRCIASWNTHFVSQIDKGIQEVLRPEIELFRSASAPKVYVWQSSGRAERVTSSLQHQMWSSECFVEQCRQVTKCVTNQEQWYSQMVFNSCVAVTCTSNETCHTCAHDALCMWLNITNIPEHVIH